MSGPNHEVLVASTIDLTTELLVPGADVSAMAMFREATMKRKTLPFDGV
jgi:hypothetical protein